MSKASLGTPVQGRSSESETGMAAGRAYASHVRRRGSLEQGRALEMLGHAVEYLMDSRLFHRAEKESEANREAVQVLMGLSRAVFLECAEVVPVRRRLAAWGRQKLGRGSRFW